MLSHPQRRWLGSGRLETDLQIAGAVHDLEVLHREAAAREPLPRSPRKSRRWFSSPVPSTTMSISSATGLSLA